MSRLTDDVGYLLSRTSGLLARGAKAALAAEGLRIRQYSVLALAADAPGGMSQRDLAEVLGLDPSQVVLLIDELAGMGLVERRPSPADRRTKLVVATDAGRRVRDRAADLTRQDVEHQLRALTGGEREVLRELLARVVATATTRPEEPDAVS